MNIEATADQLLEIAAKISRGEALPYQICEWGTTGAYDDLLFNCKDRSRLFDVLEILCARYDEIRSGTSPVSLPCFLSLLGNLACATGTTQLPDRMRRIILDNSDKPESEELKRWYRIPD